MKNLLFLIVFAVAGTLSAAQKIAVVDLEKLFREFYKTAIIEESLRNQAQVYREYLTKLSNEAMAEEKKFRQTLDKSQNLAMSEADRAKFKAECDKMVADLKGRRAEMERYGAEKTREMQSLELRRRNEVIDEIRGAVRRAAASAGYDFVLDQSGRTTTGAPLVLVSPPGVDLTAAVLLDLNRGKPVAKAAVPASNAGSKTERKADK
ncbi:MAG: OmpH family outer membrane protein [Victivallaceae bacterium]|nr:OmpH family outer membrane protein [Victivallaceae bacterium]